MDTYKNPDLKSLMPIWRVRAGSLKTGDAAYETLRAGIVSGTLQPGDRLNEEPLAMQFGVSRTPIRESLRRLEAEQLVRRAPHRGLVVCDVDSQQITEFYMFRVALDGAAAALAAKKRTPVDVAKLRWLNSKMKDAAASGDIAAITESNMAFHEAICDVAGNPMLESFIAQVHAWVRRADHNPFTFPGRPQSGAAEHEQIIVAIERGDAESAERLTREHMQRSHDLRLALLRKAG